MKQLLRSGLLIAAACLVTSHAIAQTSKKELAKQILADRDMDTVQARALRLLTGFTAGTSYGEIWIRDFNTFIKGSLKARSQQDVKDALLLFFKIQGADGNIPDGAIPKEKANVGYKYLYSDLAPGWAIHKNTVETDQESSLIQAVKKYVDATGDRTILQEKIGDRTVAERLESALKYVRKERWSDKYGLVTGATTIDWGDVQAETGWGVAINDKTKWAIDIYDNAMFLSAVQDYLAMTKDYRMWEIEAKLLKKNIRKHLWDAKAKKYIPHIYLNGSPFPDTFKEREILYQGGSTCAILAGLHKKKEIKAINQQMLDMVAKEQHATIGMTVYPPYPAEQFPNMAPYNYQNGGDWTWFGGRMIQALIQNNLPNEAYTEMQPMIARVIKNKGFYEWYDVRNGAPKGSGDFRGEAGVLYDAITQLRAWALENK
ncbi:glucosidase family protein [Mucilaginibacter myungsuensis]|uniref:Glycosyl hydrolase family 36 n=1 Tax=Mucilaginibacter myungsuensis TaxID=649104 RepID=A0A929PV61_9SPHI|nr:hypothetical protein [Mucilaginibacter myungsuensis]MBE9660799.1 hypothetical protein [Mucilaginibacter myungsuensis]MDN3600845.1 hypothetical protein [Mucilaginibacter myungsuensis]